MKRCTDRCPLWERWSPVEGMEDGAGNMVWHFSERRPFTQKCVGFTGISQRAMWYTALCWGGDKAREVRIAITYQDMFLKKHPKKQNFETFLRVKGPWLQCESTALCSEWCVEAWIINTKECIIMDLINGQSLESTNYNHFHLPFLPFEFTFTGQLYQLQRKHFALLGYSGGTRCETISHFSPTEEKSCRPPSGDRFGMLFYILLALLLHDMWIIFQL